MRPDPQSHPGGVSYGDIKKGLKNWFWISRSFFFVVMLGIVLFQILVRNLFGKSFAQLEELAIIILPWFGFFLCHLHALPG